MNRFSNIAVGIAALLIGVVAAMLLQVPYFAISPGTLEDTRELVEISGSELAVGDGHIFLTTVFLSELRLGDLPAALLNPNVKVVERAAFIPVGTTQEDLDAANQRDIELSKTAAIAAAVDFVRLPVIFDTSGADVRDILENFPASKALKVGDDIVAIDGRPICGSEDVQAAITSKRVGSSFVLGIKRDDVTTEVSLRSDPVPGTPIFPVIGVSVVSTSEKPAFTTPSLDIKIDSMGIGGPSAGLSFALGLVDLLGGEGLTKGRSIATTGTISCGGFVGPVGGVQQKVAAAEREDVDIFLVPILELPDACRFAEHVQIFGVSTLSDAVDALRNPTSATGCGSVFAQGLGFESPPPPPAGPLGPATAVPLRAVLGVLAGAAAALCAAAAMSVGLRWGAVIAAFAAITAPTATLTGPRAAFAVVAIVLSVAAAVSWRRQGIWVAGWLTAAAGSVLVFGSPDAAGFADFTSLSGHVLQTTGIIAAAFVVRPRLKNSLVLRLFTSIIAGVALVVVLTTALVGRVVVEERQTEEATRLASAIRTEAEDLTQQFEELTAIAAAAGAIDGIDAQGVLAFSSGRAGAVFIRGETDSFAGEESLREFPEQIFSTAGITTVDDRAVLYGSAQTPIGTVYLVSEVGPADVATIATRNEASVALIDSEGRVIQSVGALPESLDLADATQTEIATSTSSGEVVSGIQLSDQLLLVLTSVPGSIAEAAQNVTRALTAGLLAAAFFAAAVALWATSRIARPVVALSRAVKQFDETALAQNDQQDEITTVRRAFGAASSRVRRAEGVRSSVLSGVSHALRTPLTVIEGNARLLQSDKLNQPQRKQIASEIARGTKDLSRAVADLVDLAALETGELTFRKTTIRFGDLLDKVNKDVDRAITASPDTMNVRIKADLHLIARAVARIVDAAKSDIRIGARQVGKSVEVRIAASGFDGAESPDESTNESSGEAPSAIGATGEAPGLEFAKAILRAHGSSLEFKYRSERGALAVFQIPID